MTKPIAFEIAHYFEQLNTEGSAQEKALKEKQFEVTKKMRNANAFLHCPSMCALQACITYVLIQQFATMIVCPFDFMSNLVLTRCR